MSHSFCAALSTVLFRVARWAEDFSDFIADAADRIDPALAESNPPIGGLHLSDENVHIYGYLPTNATLQGVKGVAYHYLVSEALRDAGWKEVPTSVEREEGNE